MGTLKKKSQGPGGNFLIGRRAHRWKQCLHYWSANRRVSQYNSWPIGVGQVLRSFNPTRPVCGLIVYPKLIDTLLLFTANPARTICIFLLWGFGSPTQVILIQANHHGPSCALAQSGHWTHDPGVRFDEYGPRHATGGPCCFCIVSWKWTNQLFPEPLKIIPLSTNACQALT